MEQRSPAQDGRTGMTALVKCLVWDLDGTLWDGVVLENDGMPPKPEALRALHALDERGILHAVASRGEIDPALAHLREYGIEDMFSVVHVGWGAKSEALQGIAESLDIGIDTVAFVDNDPVERAEVAAALPDVRCYPAERVAQLPELPEFIPAHITDEARRRRNHYRAERARRSSEQQYSGTDNEFLASLELELTVRRATRADLDRANELTVRTNQLNTTGRTFDAEQLSALAVSPEHEVLVASLRDRFGEYGTIGLAVTQRRGIDDVLLLVLMSCRVMSRGVGAPFIGYLVQRATATGLRPVAEFVPTAVNRAMLVTLRFAGFDVLDRSGERTVLVHRGSGAFPGTEHVRVHGTAPRGDLLGELLHYVEWVPDRVAVVVGSRSATYREFADATEVLALRLVRSGVRPGEVVVVALRQSLDMVVAMVAALRAGAAWCVVEPGYSQSALRALFRDLDCSATIVGDDDRVSVPEGVAVLDIRDRYADDGAQPVVLPIRVPEQTPAYVINTAGSTGIPKAVVVSRANLTAMINTRDLPDGVDALMLSAMRLVWDGSLLGLCWPLATGGTGVLPDDQMLRNPATLAELAVENHIAVLVATPSLYRLLLPFLTELGSSPRVMILAGETVPVQLVAQHRARLPGTVLHNKYGPTEATVTCISFPVDHVPEQIVAIGRPMHGCAAYVLDAQLRPVAKETLGDLYVGGPQIVQGYAARPVTTAVHFVPDPFATAPDARMYRTGDLARIDSSGELEFHGRVDGQVKVRGVRVERHAVEATLDRHPAIREAAVVDTVDSDGEVSLTAFCVASDTVTERPRVPELIEFCRGQLTGHGVPARFRFVDDLPLAESSTKRDDGALRELLRNQSHMEPQVRRDDWSDTEVEIAGMWDRALGHADFDRTDGFLDIGGDSHLLVALHMQLDARWPGTIRVGQLFDLPTVEAQAAAISSRLVEGKPSVPTIEGKLSVPTVFEL